MAKRPRSMVGDARGDIAHLSYSTLDQWFQCPKKVQLAKIMKAPTTPAWWFAGGSAVHAATEAYDHWTLGDPLTRGRFAVGEEFEKAFEAEVQEIEERCPDRSRWRAAGVKDDPEVYGKWMELGPELVMAWIRWRRESPYTIWHTPKGEPAIEINLSTTFPGCEREVKAYADRIMYHPVLDQLTIIDLKTGSRRPNSPLQFGVYAAGLEHLHSVKAPVGAAFMNREGSLAKAFSLGKYTPEYVGKLFGQLSRAVDAKVFPAHLGGSCRMCDVQDSCYAQGGEQAERYDPDHPAAPQF